MSEHYFSTRPEAPHRPGLARVVLPDVYLELATDAGVFSPGRLDPGTRLLLDEAPAPPPTGDLLDLGCGYGPVACVLAARSPDRGGAGDSSSSSRVPGSSRPGEKTPASVASSR